MIFTVGIGLCEDTQPFLVLKFGLCERLLQPDDVVSVPLLIFRVPCSGAPQVVVTTDQVEGDEEHLARGPADILPKLGILRVRALPRERDGALAEALVPLEKHFA